MVVDDTGELLNYDLPMTTRASLGVVLKNIADVAARLHDPDEHMGDSTCDGCYILSELKQIRKHFNLAHERQQEKGRKK